MSLEILLMDLAQTIKATAIGYGMSVGTLNTIAEGLKYHYGFHKKKPKSLKEVPLPYLIARALQKVVNLPLKAGGEGIKSYFQKPRTEKQRKIIRRKRRLTTATTLLLAGIMATQAYLTKDIEKVADHFSAIPHKQFLYVDAPYQSQKQMKIKFSPSFSQENKKFGLLDVIILNTAQKEAYFLKNHQLRGMTKMGIGPQHQPSLPFAQHDYYNTNGDFPRKIPYDDGYFTDLKVAAEIKRKTQNPYYQIWMGEKAILLAERYHGSYHPAQGLWLKIGPTIHGEYTGFWESLFHGEFAKAGKIAQRTVERTLYGIIDETGLNPTAGCVRFPNKVLKTLRVGNHTKVKAAYDMDMLLLDEQGNLYVIADHTNPYAQKVSENEGYQQFLKNLNELKGRKYYPTHGNAKEIRPDLKKITRAFYHGLKKGVYKIPQKESS